jgi:hypothetical protein
MYESTLQSFCTPRNGNVLNPLKEICTVLILVVTGCWPCSTLHTAFTCIEVGWGMLGNFLTGVMCIPNIPCSTLGWSTDCSGVLRGLLYPQTAHWLLPSSFFQVQYWTASSLSAYKYSVTAHLGKLTTNKNNKLNRQRQILYREVSVMEWIDAEWDVMLWSALSMDPLLAPLTTVMKFRLPD